MNDSELIEFLSRRAYSNADRQTLIDEWNIRRAKGNVGRIDINHVRTPCRLRQIVSSFKLFLSNPKP